MTTAPRPTYPTTALVPGTGGGGGGSSTTHTIVPIGGIDGNGSTLGTAQALAERLGLTDGDEFLFIQGNGTNSGSGRYIMNGATAAAQSNPTNGSTISVLHFYLDGATESNGQAEARRVSGQWTVTQGYDFQNTATRMAAPRVLEVSGNSVVAEVTRDGQGVLSHNTLALLPYDDEAEGSIGSLIKLPPPANTGQRIVAFAADGTYGGYPGETVWWEEAETIEATYSYLDITAMFGASYPLTVDTTVTLSFTGDDPDAVVTQDDTFADFMAWLTDFGTKLGAVLPAGWTTNQAPWNASAVALYRETPGEGQNISVASATNGDPLGALAWPVGDGADETTGDIVPRGVAGGGDGLLGAPGNEDGSFGATHTSPDSLNAYRKGWVIVDGDGQWAVEKWPDRMGLNHGGWTSYVGPFGTQNDVTHMAAVAEYLKAWMNPTPGEGHLIRADTSQEIGNLFEQHRWLVATTNVVNDDVTYTLEGPSNAKKYTLSFSRLGSDNGDYDFTITDGATFTVVLAPGEFCTVQSTHIGYFDGELPSGTGTGELDDPANQLWGWVRRG